MVESLIPQAGPSLALPDRTEERSGIELALLLEAIARWSGQDFRDYAPGTLKRRVAERIRAESASTISGLQELVLHDGSALRRLIYALSANNNKLFRSPEYFAAFRKRVVPFLRTYSFVRLWFPGCFSGEDVYTVATILQDEQLLDRCMIYATDVSDLALEQARAGVYQVGSIEEFANDYRLSGGRSAITDFCEADDGVVRFGEELRRQIIFSTHSLATDSSLNEFHAIVARGVLTQFNKTLQYRVHNLFLQSLARFGFVCLSPAESLHATPHEGAFRKVDDVFPIYRRMR